MRIVKTAYQSTEAAHETAYIIKGIFKKRAYYLSELGMFEIPVFSLRKVPNGPAKD